MVQMVETKQYGSPDFAETPNIQAMLTEKEAAFRTRLIDEVIKKQGPVTFQASPTSSDQVDNQQVIWLSLLEKSLIALDKNGAIAGVYPVSAKPTRHHVTLADGRSFFAMCAIDALGTAYEFNQEVSVLSSCRRCDQKININVKNGELVGVSPSTIHALHVDISKYTNWASAC